MSLSLLIVEVLWLDDPEFVCEIAPGEVVTALEQVLSSEDWQILPDEELLGFQEVLSISLSGLVEGKLPGEFLPFEGDREGISAWIGQTGLPDLDSVICQEVMDDIRCPLEFRKEFQHFSVVLQELLLRVYLAPS